MANIVKFNKRFYIKHAIINLYLFAITATLSVFVKHSLILVSLIWLIVSISFAFIASETKEEKEETCPLH